MRVRQHRGGLAESMETVKEIANTPDALLEWVNEVLSGWMPPVTIDKVTVKARGFDARIGWDTHLIHVEGFGVVGQCDTAIYPIHDLEQNDPVRIKKERDILAQSIVSMGVALGFIDPNAVLTGPHLLMICQDIAQSHLNVPTAHPTVVLDIKELEELFVFESDNKKNELLMVLTKNPDMLPHLVTYGKYLKDNYEKDFPHASRILNTMLDEREVMIIMSLSLPLPVAKISELNNKLIDYRVDRDDSALMSSIIVRILPA